MISKSYQEGVSTSGKLWGRTFWVGEATEAVEMGEHRESQLASSLPGVWDRV